MSHDAGHLVIPKKFGCRRMKATFAVVATLLGMPVTHGFVSMPARTAALVASPPTAPSALLGASRSSSSSRARRGGRVVASMGVQLFGSQGSRSPLVNWYLYEISCEFEMAELSANPHPFGQIPCLKDGEARQAAVGRPSSPRCFRHRPRRVAFLNLNVRVRAVAARNAYLTVAGAATAGADWNWRRSRCSRAAQSCSTSRRSTVVSRRPRRSRRCAEGMHGAVTSPLYR